VDVESGDQDVLIAREQARMPKHAERQLVAPALSDISSPGRPYAFG
jgi:hypothetical protein